MSAVAPITYGDWVAHRNHVGSPGTLCPDRDCEQFLQKLADQGYAPATMRTYDGAARLLCEEVARRGLGKGELAGRTLTTAHAAALKAMHPNKYNQKRYCLERFIDALVDAGAAERPKPAKKRRRRLSVWQRSTRPTFTSSGG